MKEVVNMFEDFNFKLVVMDSIMEKDPDFPPGFKEIKEKYVDSYEWYNETNPKPIPEVKAFFEQVELTPKDLDKVEDITFDGGTTIYMYLIPDWDGEDDTFDVTSVKGFEQLKNLKQVYYIALCPESLLVPMKEAGIKIL